jgi:hypothetical protein
MHRARLFLIISLLRFLPGIDLHAAANAYLTDVPDYDWWRGCFGTASGNLMGFWDRHGFPDLYTGPTGEGIAPLRSSGSNEGIRSMWASHAGFDGRAPSEPGHDDDYWIEYENAGLDPYKVAGRNEHPPDCIGDFIGLSQNKWTDLDGECEGNIDGFSFVYWDKSGERRVNFTPDPGAGGPPLDIQSGLRTWTHYRGYSCEVFTQLTDFNPEVPAEKGFTFADLKAEIDAGYPVLLFLQKSSEKSRRVGTMTRANPHIHGMLAYGYLIDDSERQFVRYHTSWASGDNVLSEWSGKDWQTELPVRGVIGFHPLPQIRRVAHVGESVTIEWEGPAAKLYNQTEDTTVDLHFYVVEKATSIDFKDAVPVTDPTAEHSVTITNCCSSFFRIRLVPPAG